MQLTFRRLRVINIVVGIFQLVTGAIICAITDYNTKGRLPWYSFFVKSWSRDNGPESDFYQPNPVKQVNFPIGLWAGIFLLLSAADHLTVALPFINGIYNKKLCLNRNPFRWMEYSVSASLMQVLIAQLCGMTDIHLLFAVGFLMGTTMLFGWLMELHNGSRLTTYTVPEDSVTPPKEVAPAISDGQKVDFTPFWFGFVPFIGSNLVLGCFFFQAVSTQDPPTFVWSIYFIIGALYLLFAVNQLLQFSQVRGWRGFAKGELWYILLSVTSKQLLAWINYGGTQRFQNEGI